MKIRVKLFVFTLILISIFSNVHAFEFSLKLCGGLSFFNPESVNQTTIDWAEWYRKNSDRLRNWTFLDGETSDLTSSFDFDIEMMFSFNAYFAAGISAGYIYGELESKKNQLSIERVGNTYLYVYPIKVTAHPMTLNGYLFLPVFNWLHIYIKGGAGIVWAKYFNREGRKLVTSENFSYPLVISASSQGSVFLGGAGFQFNTESGIRFFIEGTYRHMNVSGFDGENKTGIKGKLYNYEEYDPLLDFWQAKFGISEGLPAGENFRSVKEAEVDLSGFTIKTGIIIKF